MKDSLPKACNSAHTARALWVTSSVRVDIPPERVVINRAAAISQGNKAIVHATTTTQRATSPDRDTNPDSKAIVHVMKATWRVAINPDSLRLTIRATMPIWKVAISRTQDTSPDREVIRTVEATDSPDREATRTAEATDSNGAATDNSAVATDSVHNVEATTVRATIQTQNTV